MGGLCEERSEKGGVGRKWRERPTTGTNGSKLRKYSSTPKCPVDQPHPYTRETRGRTSCTHFGERPTKDDIAEMKERSVRWLNAVAETT